MEATKRKRQARVIRDFRKIHRWSGLALAVFFLLIGITGFLLGWKKEVPLLPPTSKGASATAADWLPVDSLTKVAHAYVRDSIDASLSLELDRIDIRPGKGIAKYLFANHYWELQVDCTTAEILSVGKRHSDFIEHLHDFSFFDRGLQNSNDIIKLIYTTLMGLAVVVFTVTGFWLWYGPKRMKAGK